MSSSSDGGHARRLQEIENGEVDGGDSTIEGGDSTIEGGDSSIGGEAIEGGDSTIEGGDSTVEGEAIEGGDSTIEGGEGTIGGEAIEGGDGTIEGGEGTIGGEAIEGGDGTIEGGEGTIGGEAIEGGDSSIGGETIGGGDAGEGEFVGGGDSSVGGGIIDGDNGYPPYVGDGGSATVDGGDSGLGGEFVENGGGLGGETIGDGSSGIGGGFHVIEKNFYEVRTKTHVIHDPVTIPGKVIHKQVTLPAKAVYNCMEGFHDWHHLWTEDQQKYCCYKVSRGCTTKIVKHLRYHTVVQNHNIPVPVPKPVPVHLPPPPPQVIKVPVHLPPPPRQVVKVPYPVREPAPEPKVITKVKYFKKPVPVPVVVHKTEKIPYVKVPIPEPSPPHIVYHTKKIVSHAYDCDEGIYHTHTVYHTKVVPKKVVMPPKIIYKDVTVHHTIDIDCNSGYSNWYYGWSNYKKHYCCSHEKRGCPGTWKGFAHGHIHVTVQKGVGGLLKVRHFLTLQAGFNNWLHGWSDSKKKWCCGKEQKGCVKFHCDHDAVSTWGAEKRDWCCGNFQKGCKGNACELAYSQIQVECDVCRSCTVQAAGCEVHAVAKDPYDCDAALNNFFRAWSPPKKQWCCNNRGKGCEGNSPPKVDPGAGMMWKHVQINGFWTWQVVAAAGGGVAAPPASLPYDCNVGVVNWKIGWSAPKKTWCCAHNKVAPSTPLVAPSTLLVAHSMRLVAQSTTPAATTSTTLLSTMMLSTTVVGWKTEALIVPPAERAETHGHRTGGNRARVQDG
eukprot:g3625.t1